MCTVHKCRRILEWAKTNSWAIKNFDPKTIENIFADFGTTDYDWPSPAQKKAVENVYSLALRSEKWR